MALALMPPIVSQLFATYQVPFPVVFALPSTAWAAILGVATAASLAIALRVSMRTFAKKDL